MQIIEKRNVIGQMTVVGVIVIIFMGMAFLAPSVDAAPQGAAMQQPQGVQGRWIFKLRVVNGKIEAQRVNQELNNGQVIDQSVESIKCTPVGAVTINKKNIELNGGYLSCELPSFRQAFFDLTGHLVPQVTTILPTEIEPWGTATVSNVDPTAAYQPIVSHSAYQMAFGISNDGSGHQPMLDLAKQQYVGPVVSLTNGANRIGSRVFECDGVECREVHGFNKQIVEDVQVPQVTPWSTDHGSSTILIGKHGSDVFLGTIHSLQFDPNVRVRPG